MENIKIIIYSFIQGITEFLPVSSSAHLYIIQDVFKWNDNMLVLALGAHLGTLLAVLFHNRKLFFSLKKNPTLILAAIASTPVIIIGGIIGFLDLNLYSSNLFIIALACILGGILLYVSDNNKKANRREVIKIKESIIIGLFQILALIPGMSRSGCIITAMRFLGINRLASINFSLLTGIPVLLAASSFGFYKVLIDNSINITKLFLVISIAFATAIVSIKFLLEWVKKFSFKVFCIYRVLLGILILIYIS
ncbi:MAG: UDP-diphosphatase [Rickettsiales bacterium]|nr:UDP-diphosphatase [Rickettsiales bacterium]OUV80988.1 MAG: hypothetical protein CBC91_02715 [Rickettsiales bacterium TMED131]|tara:strand:+ start:657 stop:1409 length:753 start_codon:yes stop_codon:yes gene_type:complete